MRLKPPQCAVRRVGNQNSPPWITFCFHPSKGISGIFQMGKLYININIHSVHIFFPLIHWEIM